MRRTRKNVAAFLTEAGYPISWAHLQKLASTGGGPPYELFGNKAIYTDETSLAWAKARCKKRAQVAA
jgi:hypothetical protein